MIKVGRLLRDALYKHVCIPFSCASIVSADSMANNVIHDAGVPGPPAISFLSCHAPSGEQQRIPSKQPAFEYLTEARSLMFDSACEV